MTAAVNFAKVMIGRFYDRASYIHARDRIGADWMTQQIRDVTFIGSGEITSRFPVYLGTASREDEPETIWQKLCRLIRRLFK